MAEKREMWQLQQMQGMPLKLKIKLTQDRIRQWVNEFGEDGVYVSFSGGKDSTVLLDIARKMYPHIKAMFVDVPTQYPELKTFAMSFDNVDLVKPKISFMQVCEQYGFPIISKEVSECVYGARKYLTKILEQESLDRQTDRQTDRQLPYAYKYRQLTGTGEYSKFSETLSNAEIIEREHFKAIRGGIDTTINTKSATSWEQFDNQAMLFKTRGGYDNKYRKLRGLGEYSTKSGNNARQVRSMVSDEKGEYP